jgi:hypothetical protein
MRARKFGPLKPPLDSFLDRRHPLAHNLEGAWLFNEGGGSSVIDVAQGLVLTPTGSFPAWTPSIHGPELEFNSTPLSGGAGGRCANLAKNGPFSIAVRFRTSAAGPICGRNDANSVSAGWVLQNSTTYISGGQHGLGLVVEFNSINLLSLIANVTDGLWHTYVVAYDGFAVSNTLHYLDGVAQSAVVTINGTGSKGDDTAQTFFVGKGNWPSEAAFVGGMAFLYIWRNRMISAKEARDITIDPYAFMRLGNLSPAAFIAAAGANRPVTCIMQ